MSEARRWGVTDVVMVCYRPGDMGVRDACRWRATDVGTGVADLGMDVRDVTSGVIDVTMGVRGAVVVCNRRRDDCGRIDLRPFSPSLSTLGDMHLVHLV